MIFGTAVAGRGHQGSSCLCFQFIGFLRVTCFTIPAKPAPLIIPGWDTFATLKCTNCQRFNLRGRLPGFHNELPRCALQGPQEFETRRLCDGEVAQESYNISLQDPCTSTGILGRNSQKLFSSASGWLNVSSLAFNILRVLIQADQNSTINTTLLQHVNNPTSLIGPNQWVGRVVLYGTLS